MGEEPRRKTDHRRMEQLVVLESRSLGKDGQGFPFFLPSINDHKERRRVSRTDHFRKCPPCPSHRPQPWAFAMIDGSRPQWRLDEISRVLTKNISEECAWHSQTIKRNKKRIWAPVKKSLHLSRYMYLSSWLWLLGVLYRFPVFCAIITFGGFPIALQSFGLSYTSDKSALQWFSTMLTMTHLEHANIHLNVIFSLFSIQ